MNNTLAVAIVNAAISRTGGNTITAFDDGSVEANLANANYEQIVEKALEAKPWRFARKTYAPALVTGCAFTGAISGTVLTVSAIASGGLVAGQAIAGSGVTGGTLLVSPGTLDANGLGTWNVNNSQSVGSEAMTATGTNPVPPLDSAYQFAYTLPADLLILRTLFLGGGTPGIGGAVIQDYEIDQYGDVLCNFDNSATPVYAVYTYRADESLWPADFTEAVTLEIMALYLRADDRYSQADDIKAEAAKVLALSALTHAQEEAPRDPRRFPLVAARFIGAVPPRIGLIR